ncbi:MAG: VOC family protein [Acidimicrobiales bacterium]
MALTTTAHLNFPGTARAALEFYQEVFGGKIQANTYGEFGMPQGAPDAGRIVFGQLEADNGFRIMAYDIPGRDVAFAGSTRREQGVTVTDVPFFLSLGADALDEITPYWEGLSDGATVIEPLVASAWSPGFGMLTDRFGVTWTVTVRPGAE